jgi:hypothetical protein
MARQRGHHRRRSLQRRTNVRELRQRFLIVCEGEKTEPNYFNSFRVPKAVVKVVGIGENTIRVVEQALTLREKDDYDQVWCVFDRDVFPVENFNAALQLARNNGIQVAYSNEAFELWYVLHFNYHQAATARHLYAEKLSDLLGVAYEKTRLDMYDRLEGRQESAIQHAEKLLGTYDPPDPARDNPSTTVHLLVQALNRFAV